MNKRIWFIYGSELNDQSLKLFIVLSRAYRAVNEHVNKRIQRYGLNPTEFAVLEIALS